jgi:hypothetical protein
MLGYFPNKTVNTRLKCKLTVEAFIMVIKIDITGTCFIREAQTCHNRYGKKKTQDHPTLGSKHNVFNTC